MDEQRVPNLQEMDKREAHRFLTDLYSRHIPEEEYNVRHQEDYVMEMPQSGERFRGRENMRSFQEAYPAVVSAGAPSAGQGGTVGCGGGHRIRRRAGIRRGGNKRASRREDVARQMVLRRAVRGSGVAGAVGRADGLIGPGPRLLETPTLS